MAHRHLTNLFVLHTALIVTSLLISAQPSTASLSGDKSQSKYSISGRIIDAITTKPLSNVKLHIANARVPPVQSDTLGVFQFTNLPSGQYVLMLNPSHGYRAPDMVVTVKPGLTLSDITIRAIPSSTITGRLLDERGHGIPGISVSALRANASDLSYTPARDLVGVSTSNEDGVYTLANLQAGNYYIFANTTKQSVQVDTLSTPIQPSDLPASHKLVPTYYPGTTTRPTAIPIQVRSGEHLTGIDFALTRQPTYCIASGIAHSTHDDQRDILIRLFTDYYFGGAILVDTQMSASESIRICGLGSGTYGLLLADLTKPDHPNLSFETLELLDRPISLSDVLLSPLKQIHGSLLVRNKVSGSTSSDVRLDLQLQPVMHKLAEVEHRRATLTSPGPFTFSSVLPAPYRLQISPPPGYFVKSAMIGTIDALKTVFIPSDDFLVVTLSDQAAALRVQLFDNDKQPVSPGVVIIARVDSSSAASQYDIHMKLTNQFGEVMFGSLRPGTYNILGLRDVVPDIAFARFYLDAHKSDLIRAELRDNENKLETVTAADVK